MLSHQTFNAHADEYDNWFNSEPGVVIFNMEVECLRPLLQSCRRPYLEVGVGTGRFARALGIEYGIDPALALLAKARARGIKVKEARGEKLPFPDHSFGGVLIALTLCFVDDPIQVLREVSRVLVNDGGLVLGLILKDSPWGEFYAGKAREGHPIYSKARFFSRDKVESLLHRSGFDGFQYRSTLFQPPECRSYHHEQPFDGYSSSAGFVVISSSK